jgi:hypothetical protein
MTAAWARGGSDLDVPAVGWRSASAVGRARQAGENGELRPFSNPPGGPVEQNVPLAAEFDKCLQPMDPTPAIKMRGMVILSIRITRSSFVAADADLSSCISRSSWTLG